MCAKEDHTLPLFPTEAQAPTHPPLPPLAPLLERATRYAGIGSRTTPQEILELMQKAGAQLAHRNILLRSGASDGADTAFELGCDSGAGPKEIFLPWPQFNNHPSQLHSPPECAETLAALCHPGWRGCSEEARKLHARNCQQIYGVDLDTPVDFVLFWAKEKQDDRQKNNRVQGGTGTAVFLAREMKIPTFNLFFPAVAQQWQTFVEEPTAPCSNVLGAVHELRNAG